MLLTLSTGFVVYMCFLRLSGYFKGVKIMLCLNKIIRRNGNG
jgi:hypothetical protein